MVTGGCDRCLHAVPHCGQRQLAVTVYVRTPGSGKDPFKVLRLCDGKSLDLGDGPSVVVVVVMQLKLFRWLIGVDFGVMGFGSVGRARTGARLDFSEIHGWSRSS